MDLPTEIPLAKLFTIFGSSISNNLEPKTSKGYVTDVADILVSNKRPMDTVLHTSKDSTDFRDLAQELYNTIETMKGKGHYQPSTRNRKRAAAHKFYEFLERLVAVKPPGKHKFEKLKTALEGLTDKQYNTIISKIPVGRFVGAGEKAIFSVIYSTGVTLNNLLAVRYNNFSRPGGMITGLTVNTRNGELSLELTDDNITYLLAYESLCRVAELKRPLETKGVRYFRGKNGKPLDISGRNVRKRFAAYAKEGGYLEISFTQLRNSYILDQASSGIGKEELADKLGVKETRAKTIMTSTK